MRFEDSLVVALVIVAVALYGVVLPVLIGACV